jgi:hypothetical protein
MFMSAAPSPYGQSINDHYDVMIAQHIQQKNEFAPVGWKKAMLHLPQDAIRLENPTEREKLMKALFGLIREKCSATDPKKATAQGLLIDLDGSEVVNKYLRGATLMLYPAPPAPQMWIEVAPVAGPGFFKG